MFIELSENLRKSQQRVPVTFQGGQPVRTYKIGRNPAIASRNTLQIMRNIILESSKNFEIRDIAEQLTEGQDCVYDQAHSIWDFIVSRSDYKFDPRGFEFIKTPPLVLSQMAEGRKPQLDCDDVTVLSLSMLSSLGIPVAIKAASYRPDKVLTHVYGLFYVRKYNRWEPLDCVNHNAGPGWEKKPATNTLIWRVP